MKRILDKYTEKLAKKRAKAIDDFIASYIPKWQTKIMFKFPFTVKFFGWELEERPMATDGLYYLGKRIDLMRFGKSIGTLMITERLTPTEDKTPKKQLEQKDEQNTKTVRAKED